MNWLFLLITLAAGIVAWLIGTLVYSGMVDTASRPWLIGLIFLILYVIVVLTVFIFSNITAVFRENMLTGIDPSGRSRHRFLPRGVLPVAVRPERVCETGRTDFICFCHRRFRIHDGK